MASDRAFKEIPVTPPRLFIVLATIALPLGACASAPADQAAQTGSADYHCADGRDFTAAYGPDFAQLQFGGASLHLPKVRAASGAKYAGGNVVLWSKGAEATLTTPDGVERHCAETQ